MVTDRSLNTSPPPPADRSRSSVWRQLSPAAIALGYSVVGLLWIVLSDLLVASVSVGGLDFNLSLMKGTGYVLVTGGGLFLVLRRREEWQRAARQELTRWVGEPTRPDLDHLRVLVVDDDPDDRRRLREAMLDTFGFTLEVDEATGVVDGRRAILERVHDVILVDHRLTEGSGIDLIRELHEVASGPMIVVTDSNDPEIDREAQRAGAHDHLLKYEIETSWIGRTLRYAVTNWRAQREVARTRQWYAEIVNETPVGLFRSTPAGDLTEANPALLDIFGARSLDELLQVGVRALYRDPQARDDLIARVAAGETVEDEDIAMRRLDGTPIDVRMRMRGISDTGGLMALYGAIVDVTSKLANESRIRTQASMLDQVKNAVVRTDRTGRVTYWNRAAETLFGWRAEEALGRFVVELIPPPAERGREAAIIAALTGTGSWEGEYLCGRKDGATFPAYVSISALTSPTGVTTGFVGITVDLSELKGAEARASAQEAMAASVLETVHFPAAVLDAEGAVVAVNGAWTNSEIATAARLETVGVGANYLEVCDRSGVPDAVVVGAGIRGVLAGRDTRFTHEYAGGDQWFRLEVVQAVKPLGGAVAMHIDITDLRDAARQAEAFAHSKDRLIASVSHELRTPLTAVLGFADLIEDPDRIDQDEMAQFAKEIHRQATDMAAIVDDLLVAARAEMGALTVQPCAVDPAEEIHQVTKHMRHHPSITVEARVGTSPAVWADPLRLRQILRNLVNNAVRYGGSRVRIDTVTWPTRVDIRVTDDGDGVPPHLVETIFEPFFSAHDRTGQPDSLGLGLSVVRTLTEAMGGTINLEVERGWTIFTVSLPRSDA